MAIDEPEGGKTPRDEASSPSQFAIPSYVRIILVLVFVPVAIGSLVLILRYALVKNAAPSELNLGAVFVFACTVLILALAPWGTMGLRIRKIGALEFDQVIKTQKHEQSESIVYLQKQIDVLKHNTEGRQAVATQAVSEEPPPELAKLVEQFLRQYRPWFFSPLRIKKWGSKQSGFQAFDSCTKEEINQTLLTMLSMDKVKTKISRNGNTLYGFKA